MSLDMAGPMFAPERRGENGPLTPKPLYHRTNKNRANGLLSSTLSSLWGGEGDGPRLVRSRPILILFVEPGMAVFEADLFAGEPHSLDVCPNIEDASIGNEEGGFFAHF